MRKNNQKIRCQQNLLHPNKDLLAILEYLCGEANKVFNCSLYLARQVWFKEHRFIGKTELCKSMKWNGHFGAMYASSAQQICHGVVEAFRSFKELLSLFKKGELEFKPKPPKYRRQGLFTVSYPNRWLKLTEKGIRCPLGLKVKAWFGIDSFYLPMAKNLDWDSIKEIRILPRNGCFYTEYVYGVTEQPTELDINQALSIDHGLNNWLTCVDTQGHSFIVDGKQVKSKNQWYNKRASILKEGKPQGFWSKQLAALTERRNRQMRDAINKAAKIIIDHCLKHKIGRIVFGWNKGQKQSIKLGDKVNQEFVSIPTARLKSRIEQLCGLHGIEFIKTEESYTSKASFLDGDFIPAYGEKPDNWTPSGKRIKRGLYQSGTRWLINADGNGAANILRKVARRLEIDLSRLSRGALTTPLRVRFWTA